MAKRAPGTLRIIGGAWRSRLIDFVPVPGLRPTPDRVRQTLFDWLAPLIEGARCLDLFAGSGALGLEALSRGAAHVTFVDSSAAQAATIRAALARFDAATRAMVETTDALSYSSAQPFDIVFLDPPYDAGLLGPALTRLPPLLKPDNRVYLESRRMPALPEGYRVLREKKAGQVSYALITHTGTRA